MSDHSKDDVTANGEPDSKRKRSGFGAFLDILQGFLIGLLIGGAGSN
ncbi:MAG: hypothetical protein IPG59_11625 [Candidatus Melainabacteria bacterium]|nr:MAG: hypothetical protein IPG59_11625 [Candidatus Melainabacteria bacterium]